MAAPDSGNEEFETVPESLEPQADGSPEDIISSTLKRENSLRHSQRHAQQNGRYTSPSCHVYLTCKKTL